MDCIALKLVPDVQKTLNIHTADKSFGTTSFLPFMSTLAKGISLGSPLVCFHIDRKRVLKRPYSKLQFGSFFEADGKRDGRTKNATTLGIFIR